MNSHQFWHAKYTSERIVEYIIEGVCGEIKALEIWIYVEEYSSTTGWGSLRAMAWMSAMTGKSDNKEIGRQEAIATVAHLPLCKHGRHLLAIFWGAIFIENLMNFQQVAVEYFQGCISYHQVDVMFKFT